MEKKNFLGGYAWRILPHMKNIVQYIIQYIQKELMFHVKINWKIKFLHTKLYLKKKKDFWNLLNTRIIELISYLFYLLIKNFVFQWHDLVLIFHLELIANSFRRTVCTHIKRKSKIIKWTKNKLHHCHCLQTLTRNSK